MNKTGKKIPVCFKNEVEAGKFWDTHSASDYWNELEDMKIEFDLKEKVFLVPLKVNTYKIVKKHAEAGHLRVGDFIDSVLNREIVRMGSVKP